MITTLSALYQTRIILPPLDNDHNKDGKPSDHNIVVMSAISVMNNKPARETKIITFRPITEAGVVKMDEWFKCQNWDDHFKAKNVDEQAHEMMTKLRAKLMNISHLSKEKLQVTTNSFSILP